MCEIMENESVFGIEPEQLHELLSLGDDLDDSAAQNEKSPSLQKRSSEDKSKSPETTATLDTFVERPGSWVGPYKLIRVLGEGGMGIVYLAEQKQPIRRQVAVKVIKPGMDSKRVVSRFESERQALALLDHPNIAHVYDAGTTQLGRPYFVMEYVKGIPITEYCDHHKLTIEERLNLFRQVCLAVHHAHQKGIIHRDIKPSNILVSVENNQAIPKIIDFGVAKATGKPLTERTLATEDTQLLGTPEYMSPEQADMANEDIDTRSDIYSLGVLLYVLLTGVLPFDSDTLRTGGIEHIRKVIHETDPKTPSTRLTKLGEEARKVAEKRRTEVGILARRLHRELEWIPLKAMRKERLERYRSASELADDIENYLKGAPLIAGPPTSIYRLKKFMRRNAVVSAAVLAVAVTLFLGLAVTTAMYLQAERALGRETRARAEAERARAGTQAIADFLTKDVLGSAQRVKGRDATAIDLLDFAAAKLEEGTFKDQPLVEAAVRDTLYTTYDQLGHYKQSIPHKARQYDILRQDGRPHWGPKNWLALAYRRAGEYNQAESLLNELIRDVPKTSVLYYPCRCNLAHVYYGQGRYQEAERLLLDAFRRSSEDDESYGKRLRDGYTNELGKIYREQGRYGEAEPEFIREIEADMKHKAWDALMGMCHLACMYVDLNRHQEAEEFFTKAIEGGRRKLSGKRHPTTLIALNGLAVLRTRQNNFDEAEDLFREVWDTRKEKLGDDHPETLQTINDFGVLRREQQRYDEAESLLRQALNGRQHKLGKEHHTCFESMHELAILYKEQTRYDESEKLLLEAVEGRRLKLGDTHPHTLESWTSLIELYEAWDKPEKAKEWRTRLSQTEASNE